MSQQRFIRCPHCGLPHEAAESRCPVTGEAIAIASKPRSSRSGPSDAYSWEHSLHPWSKAEESELDPIEPSSFVGRTVEGKYRIEALIGQGGMGAVFRAVNIRIGKPVALKVLTASYTPGSEPERRFLREARLVGSIGHPSIVEVFDLGRLEDGKPFQVMELLEGQTLAERLRIEGALPEPEALDIAEQVLSALDAAHRRGVVHRDLKPENVYLAERGATKTVKLLDFGVSKSLSEHSLSLTMPGMVVGTPYYLSPEQARGARDVDHRVDIWSMGVLLYEVLTGALPFTAKTYEALLVKILETRPVLPSRYQPRLTPDVEAVVMRALDPDIAARFASAGEMRAELRAARAISLQHRFPSFGGDTGSDTAADVTVREGLDEIDDPTEVSDS